MSQLPARAYGRRLAVVVSCTATKLIPAVAETMIQKLPHGPGRVGRWAERLNRQERRLPLRALYGGPMWQSALDLEQCALKLGHDVDLWVASAGLGLAPADDSAPGYQASFSPGPDQVADTPEGRRSWWAALESTPITGRRAVDIRSVREQADQVLLTLPPTYLEGLAHDLAGLAADDGVAVMSSVRRDGPGYLTSRGLRRELGGTQITLNTRAAATFLSLIGDTPIGSREAGELWSAWAAERQQREDDPRPGLDDEAVRRYIRDSLAIKPTSRTALLTRLRRSGSACEQARFARLYTQVKEGW